MKQVSTMDVPEPYRYLYNLTLQKATGIVEAIKGNFSGTKQEEILIARGKVLELVKLDSNTGKIHTVLTSEVFGIIRSINSFKLAGGTKDYIIVDSESGNMVILEYNPIKNAFEKVYQDTYGKSGCQKIVPGQHLAVDLKGRAVIIGAEKKQLVYIMNCDAQAHFTISSLLETQKCNTLLCHTVAIDVGLENPIFACLEINYEEDKEEEAAQKTQQVLTFYELDLVQKQIVPKYSEPLNEYANFLITVPGGTDGPSGLLVCSENYITYKNFGEQNDIRCPIPRRKTLTEDLERGVILVCSAVYQTKSMLSFLVQTEQGDIFRLTMETDDANIVKEVKLKYVDTVPVATSMCVLNTEFLFVAAEFGDHYLYTIAHLGDDGDDEFSSATPLEEEDFFFFHPGRLKNLKLVHKIESLSPLLAFHIGVLTNDVASLLRPAPQLYAMCGLGPRSTFRVIRYGLKVTELEKYHKYLAGNPIGVWTVKRCADGEYDAYVLVSSVNATRVFSIGEGVEEVKGPGFLGKVSTLGCSTLGDNTLLQVHPGGICHVRASGIDEWKSPAQQAITRCAVNHHQVVVSLAGGELIYFETDSTGKLNECTRKDMSAEVVCLALAKVPSGQRWSRILAVGLDDSTVRIVSLDPNDCLKILSIQALPATPESLCIVEVGGQLFLYIGLRNGVLLRAVLDSVTGDLTDTCSRYLGSRPVKLFLIKTQGNDSVLAISCRTWISYFFQNRFYLAPLYTDSLEFASGFASEQCPEGIVAIASRDARSNWETLRFLSLETLGTFFSKITHLLDYTPRKYVVHESGHLVMIETDHNAYTGEELSRRTFQIYGELEDIVTAEKDEFIRAMLDEEEFAEFTEFDFTVRHIAVEEKKKLYDSYLATELEKELDCQTYFGAPKAASGMWASLIRSVYLDNGDTRHVIELPQNEAALSIGIAQFQQYLDQIFVLVGVAKDRKLNPRECDGGFIYTYKFVPEGGEFELMHETPVEDAPYAICAYQERVLIGVGRLLCLYDMDNEQLLRKCENKDLQCNVLNIQALGNRVYVADSEENTHFVRYNQEENRLVMFSDDTNPRFVTTMALLDSGTVAVADKFGNISVLRLPAITSDGVDDDPTENKWFWDRDFLSGASSKAELLCCMHLGETALSLQKTTLIPGQRSESLVYTTLNGTIGLLVPFSSKDDYDFFQELEMHLRKEFPSMCGDDHLAFRSSFFPVKNMIDGDLCEHFYSLEPDKQKSIADKLDRTPNEVSKKLEDIRTSHAF